MFVSHPDLFVSIEAAPADLSVKPWCPRVLDHQHWPPDYQAVYAWRMRQLMLIRTNAGMLDGAKAYYAANRAEFIMHWMDTYNPRKVDGPKWMPFVFFSRQADLLEFFAACERDQESGLVEKCRDAGVTWLACAYSVCKWLFDPASAVGWGSRKEQLVDKLGDDDSIFEKIRKIIRRLPKEFLPKGFNRKEHLTYMRVINPENGATITGEAGDNIGRGGRKTIYFKDESAHYERPELIEAALGDNTNVQIDISSVNGFGNVFHRRREAGEEWSADREMPEGKTRVFIFDWRDHPEKTQEWYDKRKAKYVSEGLAHIFAQEVDRDYSGAVANTIIAYEWVMAAKDAHVTLAQRWPGYDWTGGKWAGALDVADGGADLNALSKRKGIVCRFIDEWGERDTGATARRAIMNCRMHRGMVIQYDCIGVGAGVKAEYNRLLKDENLIGKDGPIDLTFVPWNAGLSGEAMVDPWERLIKSDEQSPFNKDHFGNLKAQAWFNVSLRFWRTYQAIVQGVFYPPDELISIDGTLPLFDKLAKELAQPTMTQSTGTLKMIVDKAPNGAHSPNLADAFIMSYFAAPQLYSGPLSGSYGQGGRDAKGYRQ